MTFTRNFLCLAAVVVSVGIEGGGGGGGGGEVAAIAKSGDSRQASTIQGSSLSSGAPNNSMQWIDDTLLPLLPTLLLVGGKAIAQKLYNVESITSTEFGEVMALLLFVNSFQKDTTFLAI